MVDPEAYHRRPRQFYAFMLRLRSGTPFEIGVCGLSDGYAYEKW